MRKFDIILWGATGFTGNLVASYLLKYAPQQLRIAFGGRSLEKLSALRNSLAQVESSFKDVPLVLGDNMSPSSMEDLAQQTRVIISTVGPYSLYGTNLVEACINQGTHYCDLTGELPWVKELIDKYHETAMARRVKIVPMCGFDSIPSDLGTFMVVNHFKTQAKQHCKKVTGYFGPVIGGASGGTLASAMAVLEGNQEKLKQSQHPYSLNPLNVIPAGSPPTDQIGIKFEYEVKKWTGPFIMGPVNSRVVRRSHGLSRLLEEENKNKNLDFGYAKDFQYRETITYPNVFAAFFTTLFLGVFFALLLVRPTRNLLKKFLPAPGEGPSKQQMAQGRFRAVFVGHSESLSGGQPIKVIGEVEGRDPGYGETSTMLAEAGICLALGIAPENGPSGGILTPATAFGTELIDRLRQAGMLWKVHTVAD